MFNLFFSNITLSLVGTSTAIGTGQANTNAIIAQDFHTNSAAQICADYELNGYTDWFLPSIDELELMYTNRASIGCFASNYYWSSSEFNSTSAWEVNFATGIAGSYSKGIMDRVRAIRAFSVEEDIWVRTMPMTCWQVWINKDNNFQFIFWYPYKDKNWVKIYDMDGELVWEIDFAYGDNRFEVDLPDGMYMVKTYHGEKLLQEFLIGKP